MPHRILGRWRDRQCACTHPRSIHTGDIAGWSVCNALRCACSRFSWAWLDTKPLRRLI